KNILFFYVYFFVHLCFKSPLSCHAVRRCSAPALPAASITALQAVDLWRRCFEQRGVTEPRMSSHYIIAHLLGAKTIQSLEQEKLIEFLSREQMEQVWELCTKRLSRVPVQYVIEEWDFRDITLKMKPPVFIPRPETEVEEHQSRLTFIEVGCGSGAISLSLLKSLPQLKAVALDQSVEAVDLTWENALRLGVQDRIKLHNMDIMKDGEALLSICDPAVALVSNPPYLFSDDMSTLEPEIFRYEDHAALDGGVDGLKVIKQILMIAPQILLNHGRVYLEVEPRHPPLIRQWVEVNVEELRYIETRHDITGRPRFCILQREES
uniref:peptide chain release factor N(5)-glutamine methyltransferase n=1 Tax=Gouania willdenowi TaxID=441366 RepID=A0A8C5NCZ6_GOUWI